VESDGCRWRFVLGQLGEPTAEDCGHCDNCLAADRRPDRAAEAEPADPDDRFPPGAEVRHAEWGEGTVVSCGGDTVTVLFRDEGYRNLSAALLVEHGLLEVR